MRLLFVTPDFPPSIGGIQTYSFELALRFAAWSEAFEVIAPAAPGQASLDKALPFPVHRIRSSSNAMMVRAFPTVWRRARHGRFEAVFHAHWAPAPASGLASRGGWPKRVFVAVHGREVLLRPWARIGPAQGLYDTVRRRVLRRADRLFPVSANTAALVRGLGVDDDRIQVVPNGVDAARFESDAPDERARRFRDRYELGDRPCVVTVTRLHPYKGVDTGIAALSAVRDRVPGATYVVVGDGPDLPRLKALAAAAGVSDHVRFLGTLTGDEVVDALHACDVLALLSRVDLPNIEGFGLVLLEAGACGKPVVGARSGGIPEAVADGATGLLVPPDDPRATADALVRILGDPALAARLGAAGLRRARDEMTWDRAARSIFDAMQATL